MYFKLINPPPPNSSHIYLYHPNLPTHPTLRIFCLLCYAIQLCCPSTLLSKACHSLNVIDLLGLTTLILCFLLLSFQPLLLLSNPLSSPALHLQFPLLPKSPNCPSVQYKLIRTFFSFPLVCTKFIYYYIWCYQRPFTSSNYWLCLEFLPTSFSDGLCMTQEL